MSLLRAQRMDMVGINFSDAEGRGVKKHLIHSPYLRAQIPDRYFNPAYIAKFLPDNLKVYATRQCYYFSTNQINVAFNVRAPRYTSEVYVAFDRRKPAVYQKTLEFLKPSEEELSKTAKQIADKIIEMFG